jgi:hypothetical protein
MFDDSTCIFTISNTQLPRNRLGQKKKQANLQAHKCQETGWEEKKTGKSACVPPNGGRIPYVETWRVEINQSPMHRLFVSFVALDDAGRVCIFKKH